MAVYLDVSFITCFILENQQERHCLFCMYFKACCDVNVKQV